MCGFGSQNSHCLHATRQAAISGQLEAEGGCREGIGPITWVLPEKDPERDRSLLENVQLGDMLMERRPGQSRARYLDSDFLHVLLFDACCAAPTVVAAAAVAVDCVMMFSLAEDDTVRILLSFFSLSVGVVVTAAEVDDDNDDIIDEPCRRNALPTKTRATAKKKRIMGAACWDSLACILFAAKVVRPG